LGFLTAFRKLARFRAGVPATIQWAGLRFAARAGLPEPALWRVHPHQVLHPLQARLRGSSDLQVFDQMFILEEYAGLRGLAEPSLVLDLGANVGYSAAYFLSVFPKARIVAVEPDDRNVAICRANLAPYGGRALILHGAVWSRIATLRLLKGSYGDGRESATQVGELSAEEVTSESVQSWDVGTLIDMSGGDMVDLLKVDIERAELSVFGESAASWLPRVRNISIELHGGDCEEVFFAALKDFDYDLAHFSELTICRNLRPRQMPGTKPNSP
jgi:FkbM family methyltransferase